MILHVVLTDLVSDDIQVQDSGKEKDTETRREVRNEGRELKAG